MSSTSGALLRAAAREFNAGRYFEAHEVLEEGLDGVADERWDLIVGLIQIAVGYHKATQALWSGVLRMLELGLEKVETAPDVVDGLHVEDLRARVRGDVARVRGGDFGAVLASPPRLLFRPPG